MIALVAVAEAREPSVGELAMPLTPSEGQDTYVGMMEEPGAGGGRWTSDTAGFVCRGVGDWVEVEVAAASWPSVVPKELACADADGHRVRVPIRIEAERQVPMFVPDGTLVMPRLKKASVIYEGPPPNPSLVVQQGKTADLTLHCDVLAGPVLRVVVDPGAKDQAGWCTLKDPYGATTRVPILVVTVR